MIFISIYFPPSFFFVLFSFVSRIRNGNSIQTWIVLRCDTRKGRHDGYPSRSQLFLWVEYKREVCSGWRGVWADQSILNLFLFLFLSGGDYHRTQTAFTFTVHTYIFYVCREKETESWREEFLFFFLDTGVCVWYFTHAEELKKNTRRRRMITVLLLLLLPAYLSDSSLSRVEVEVVSSRGTHFSEAKIKGTHDL